MKKPVLITILSVVALAIGVGVAFLFTRGTGNGTSLSLMTEEPIAAVAEDASQIKNGDVFGSNETDSFKDTAQGYLQAGGMNGEGSHSLLRTGGKSQTVYLTSSVTDLDQFVGMEVKVWGETFGGQSAGWLMDVGRIEVINTQGTSPEE